MVPAVALSRAAGDPPFCCQLGAIGPNQVRLPLVTTRILNAATSRTLFPRRCADEGENGTGGVVLLLT